MPTYPLTFPSTGLKKATMALARRTSVATSPFTGTEQRSEWPFSLWSVTGAVIEIGLEDDSEVRDWRAFILELHGQAGTFRMPVPGIDGPSSGYDVVSGQGLVDTADQIGESVTTKNWQVSTLILNRGDYFMIGDELKMCMQTATSDVSGNLTLVFEPAMHKATTLDQVVTLANPNAIMRMITDSTQWAVRGPMIHTFSFEAVEVKQQ